MFCKNCGHQISNIDTVCPNCGSVVNTAAPAQTYPADTQATSMSATPQPQRAVSSTGGAPAGNAAFYMTAVPKPKKHFNLLDTILNALGTLTGFISVIIGMAIALKDNPTSYSSYETYGGDAYTGIQNAAAHAANNISHLFDLFQSGIAAVLVIVGLIAVCYFAGRLIVAIRQNKNSKNENA